MTLIVEIIILEDLMITMSKQNVTRPFKGMHTDTSPLDQPKGSYTMAWNAVNETSDGNNNFVSNEQSNGLCGQLSAGYRPIGDVYVSNDNTVVFSTNGIDSEIGLIDENCVYTILVNTPCLNFKITSQIDSIFRVRKGCERTIYFTDGINPVRYINIDNLEEFKDTLGDWDCDLMKLFLALNNPCFDSFEIVEQGELRSGTYSFAIQYLDGDLNPTKWTYITQPVPIFKSFLSDKYQNIVGSSNSDVDSMGGTSATNKAIKVFLSNLDNNYRFYRYAVIESSSFNGQVTKVYASSEIPIGQNYFIYDGGINGFTEININDIRIQPESIESAQHIEQLENRVILSNIKGKPLDFCGFQKSASAISSKYVIKSAPSNDNLKDGNSKEPSTYWNSRGYMGDEVYAFGIVYVFDDGFETPAYHIPGIGFEYDGNPCVEDVGTRTCLYVIESPGNATMFCTGTPTTYTINYTLNGVPISQVITISALLDTPNVHEIACVDNGTITAVSITNITNFGCTSEMLDSLFLVGDQDISTICPKEKVDPWELNIAHLYPDEATYNALPLSEKVEKWRIFNTAKPITSDSGYMAYWESQSTTYTNILDCTGSDYWGTDVHGNALVGMPIRHHKFPDRNLIPHYTALQTTVSYESTLVISIDFQGTEAELATLLQPQFVGDPNESEELTISYDLDGVPQVDITIRLYNNDFIYDAGSMTYTVLIRQIVTRTGTSAVGIDNVTFSNAFGLDPNTVSLNISTSNGIEVSPGSLLESAILGIQFDNIVYPHPDIVGHYIVRGDRDQFNRTVLDKGISNGVHNSTHKGIAYHIFSFFAGGPTSAVGAVSKQSDNYNYLLTPSLLFENDPPTGAYMKQINRFQIFSVETYGNFGTPEEFDNLTEFGAGVGQSAVFGDGYATLSSTRRLNYRGLETIKPAVKLRKIYKSILLNGLTSESNFVPGNILYNVSHTNKVQIVNIDSSIHGETTRNIPYVSIKVDRDVHPNLFSIQYYRTHNCVLKNNEENRIFGGDTFIAPFELSNSLFYQFNDSVWDTVLYIGLMVVAVVATVFTAGITGAAIAPLLSALAAGAVVSASVVTTGIVVAAVLAGVIGITAYSVETVIAAYRDSGLQEVVQEDAEFQNMSDSTKNYMEYANEYIDDVYIETTLNLGLRQDHTIYNPGNTFYREQEDIRAYFRDKIMVFDESTEVKKDQWTHRGTMIPEVYHYNKDYSKFNKDNVYTPLPEFFDCCSDCLNEHPTRVQYSEQSFQEENIDNYRVFLVNNYRDIEGMTGSITNIFRKHNNLFIHTEEALWQLPQNIQQRVTGDLISFIGTGEYFSIPPRLILDDKIGSAGSTSKWATIKTDTGVFFIDESNRDIYLSSTGAGMKAISNEGMRNFFKRSMIPFLEEQYYRLTDVEFPNKDNHANPNGVGYNSVYDSRHERVIFTKRDYLILPELEETFTIETSDGGVITGIVSDQLFFDTTTRQFGIGTGIDTFDYVLLENPLYFQDKSWTLSFSLLNNTWTSFHSYLPLYYYYIHNKFYSFVDNEIWKHNLLGSYQNFYGTRYPHTIEYISLSSPTATRLWDEVMLQTMARVYDVTTGEYTDERFKTFNKAIFYNSRQCTGLLELIVKDNDSANYLINQVVNTIGSQIKIDRNERNWTLNEIRDYRTNYLAPIWSQDWNSVKSEFPTDKVLNSSTIDFNKAWFELQSLRDKYLIIRLIFDNFDDVNLITNYSFERETQSFR